MGSAFSGFAQFGECFREFPNVDFEPLDPLKEHLLFVLDFLLLALRGGHFPQVAFEVLSFTHHRMGFVGAIVFLGPGGHFAEVSDLLLDPDGFGFADSRMKITFELIGFLSHGGCAVALAFPVGTLGGFVNFPKTHIHTVDFTLGPHVAEMDFDFPGFGPELFEFLAVTVQFGTLGHFAEFHETTFGPGEFLFTLLRAGRSGTFPEFHLDTSGSLAQLRRFTFFAFVIRSLGRFSQFHHLTFHGFETDRFGLRFAVTIEHDFEFFGFRTETLGHLFVFPGFCDESFDALPHLLSLIGP